MLDDSEQGEGAARRSTALPHHVDGAEVFWHVEKLTAVSPRAGHLLVENLGASRAAKLPKLGVDRLGLGADGA